jgi:hypothetical protein
MEPYEAAIIMEESYETEPQNCTAKSDLRSSSCSLFHYHKTYYIDKPVQNDCVRATDILAYYASLDYITGLLNQSDNSIVVQCYTAYCIDFIKYETVL